jgi:uncharacterized protein (DUF1501 family)
MFKQTRRQFLAGGGMLGAFAAGLVACTTPEQSTAPPPEPLAKKPAARARREPVAVATQPVPTAEPAAQPPAKTSKPSVDDRILVVIQLSGGQDGLNLMVPFNNGMYYQSRPQVAIPGEHTLQITPDIGLHPSARGFKDLYDRGKLALIHGTGYPNMSRSHFRSMEIWHTGTTVGSSENGWLGAFMSEVYKAAGGPFQCCSMGNNVPRALANPSAPIAALQDITNFAFVADRKVTTGKDPLLKTFGQMTAAPSRKLPMLELVSSTLDQTANGVDVLAFSAGRYQPAAQYPTGPFGKNLQNVAQMLASDLGGRVFYVSMGGFDTHSNQKQAHANLMAQYTQGLNAFYRDLEAMGKHNQVVIVGFSEFGRRVRENGSNGTDHGMAGPMFVIGGAVKGGVYGETPSLTDLDDGDLKFTTDFRQVYATVIEDWLGMGSKKVLNGSYDKLGFIA